MGEVWWEKWPDLIYDPAPWLQGDVFDAVMNYRWFMPTRSFFAGAEPRPRRLSLCREPRLAGARHRPGAHEGDDEPDREPRHAAVRDLDLQPGAVQVPQQPARGSRRTGSIGPDERTRRTQENILVQQFTYIGAPHIWNGDEVGMWGADDPDERKPMVWADLRYEDEVTHPFGRARRRDRVAPDTALFRVYRDLIALRKAHLRLFVDGDLRWLRKRATECWCTSGCSARRGRSWRSMCRRRRSRFRWSGEGRYRVAYPVAGGNGGDRGRLEGGSARVWIRE